MPVITQGQKLSILLARAISRAPALHGLAVLTGCRREGDRVGEEKESRYSPMKNSSFSAQQMNRTVCGACQHVERKRRKGTTNPAVVILVQDPAAASLHLLVALAGTSHAQGRVHVHVVTGHVQSDQALEDNGPSWPGGAQEDQQTRGRAPIRHHVQHRTKCGRLVIVARRISIQSIQQARHAVKEGARPRVQRHIVEGGHRQHNTRIS